MSTRTLAGPHNRIFYDIPVFHSLIIRRRENLMSHVLDINFLYRITKKKHRQCTYKRNNGARSRYHFCRGKAISITYTERGSVASVIQHVMRMRCIILSPVACLALPYFSTLSHEQPVHVTVRVTTMLSNVPYTSCLQDSE